MQINVVNHPLLQAKMTILRDKDTKSVTFRHIISEVAALLTFETTRDLPVEEVKVTTPLCETTGCRIKGSVTVVPILRAGLGFMEGVLSVIPEANVGHIGMSRNEETITASCLRIWTLILLLLTRCWQPAAVLLLLLTSSKSVV